MPILGWPCREGYEVGIKTGKNRNLARVCPSEGLLRVRIKTRDFLGDYVR